MSERKVTNHKFNMAIARESSWLYELFQDAGFTAKEKQQVLRSLMEDFRDSRETR